MGADAIREARAIPAGMAGAAVRMMAAESANGRESPGEEEAVAFARSADRAESIVGSGDEEGPPLDVITAGEPGEMASSLVQSGGVARSEAAAPVEETDTAPLPSLDAMIERIPTPVREALEELFRPRWLKVVRVPAEALKRQAPTGQAGSAP